MKVLHFANLGRRRSGLYECTKDQIKYERNQGLDSQLAIYEYENPVVDQKDDGWMEPVSWDWAEQADIFVIHRGLPESVKLKFPKTKRIMIIHGNVEYLMLDDIASNAENQNLNVHINLMASCDANVSVNSHDYDIYKLYDQKNNLELIHDAIDMERYTINGYAHPYLNHPQIIYADSLRINKNPSHVIWAMNEVCKKIPQARLSVYGLSLETIMTWRNLILRSKDGVLGTCCEDINLQMSEIRPFMRGADMLYNGNIGGIPSRVEMEAMASGCQVLSAFGGFTKWNTRGFDIKTISKTILDCWEYIKVDPIKARVEARAYALEHFNMEKQVIEKYIPLYNKVLQGAK